MSNPTKATILTIDDEACIRESFAAHLEIEGYKALVADGGAEGLDIFEREKPDLVLVDLRMREVDGLEVLARVTKESPETPIIVVSATGNIYDAIEALRLGAWDYLLKPIEDMSILTHAVEKALERARLIRENCEYQQNLEKLIAEKTQKLQLANEELAVEKERLAVTLHSKERLAHTLHSIGDAVITMDMNGRIVLLNTVAEELTGWTQTEADGKFLTDVFHLIHENTREQCENPVELVKKIGRACDLADHMLLVAKDGQEKMIAGNIAPLRNDQGNPAGLVMVCRNITQRRRLEEEIQKGRKLESIGILAGGIAHDYNNLLTVIIGNLSLGKLYSKPESVIFEILTAAERASLKAKKLTQQLITFSKGGAPMKKPASISKLIEDTAGLVLSGSNVRCEFSLPHDLWWTEMDEGQIGQTISNLLINAQEAMPEGGLIEIVAENIMVRAEDGLPLKEGNYVKVSVKDHGVGISKEDLSKVFDPYFTTKQKGAEKGSGLGLAIAYSIIKRHGGYIGVESEVGVGTTFTIFLPATEKEIYVVKEVVEEKVWYGKGKILLMDDEEDIRNMADRMLTLLGYHIELAEGGAEAIEIYKKAKESGQGFDAVILDLTVRGGMGGKETIKKILEIDSGGKAIVSSGYSYDPIMSNYKQYGFIGVITKPYEINELSEVLEKVMRAKESPLGILH